jgi:hypothetical protein
MRSGKERKEDCVGKTVIIERLQNFKLLSIKVVSIGYKAFLHSLTSML